MVGRWSVGMLVWVLGCVEYGLGDPDTTTTPAVSVTETFTQSALPNLDVLFVVDSTGSMAEEQTGLAGAAGRFLDGLHTLGVDYQVGVTTTDPATEGVLLGEPWIITPASEDPAGALGAALRVGTDSVPPSAGLDAAAAAMADPDGPNLGFRRADAALHVIFISDGDDESGAVLGDDPVGAFLSLLSSEAAKTGRVALASAVVGEVPDGCDGPNGNALPGTRYVEVAVASHGRSVSICTEDFGAVVDAIGDLGVEWSSVFPLQADPVDGSVEVRIDGARQVDGWSVDHGLPALVFAVPPAPDVTIEVSYDLVESR